MADESEGDAVRVLELFAGLGGMRLALSYAGLRVKATAIEINKQALAVYAHNFGAGDVVNRDLCGLSPAWFQKQNCRIWTMSPPCQPYTRQGKLRDAEDPRAKPLLHIVDVLRKMDAPPAVIVLENVQNFERSESCARLLEVLSLRGYAWRSFLLSPRTFGFPNARRRFYLVAKLGLPFDFIPDAAPAASAADCESAAHAATPLVQMPCLSHLRRCAQGDPGAEATLLAAAGAEDVQEPCAECGRDAPMACRAGPECEYKARCLSEFLLADGDTAAPFLVPESTMRKEAARCFDVLRPTCRHSLCFTKAYGRYIDGTGSVLAGERRLAEPSEEEYTMRDFFGYVRYFSPQEVAGILGFKLAPCSGLCLPCCDVHEAQGGPEGSTHDCCCSAFSLGEDCGLTSRELWALLGNSLNPQVVALVCRACGVSEAVGALPASGLSECAK